MLANYEDVECKSRFLSIREPVPSAKSKRHQLRSRLLQHSRFQQPKTLTFATTLLDFSVSSLSFVQSTYLLYYPYRSHIVSIRYQLSTYLINLEPTNNRQHEVLRCSGSRFGQHRQRSSSPQLRHWILHSAKCSSLYRCLWS